MIVCPMWFVLQSECDTYHCQYDGTDCSYHTPLYQNCSAIRFDIPCHELFGNGVCDRACNSAECLYDGGDCDTEVEECAYNEYCVEHYADGSCDKGCNVAECLWDGLDCLPERHFARGLLVLVVGVPPDRFVAEFQTRLLRQIGHLLHTVVSVARDAAGNEMIERREIHDGVVPRDRRGLGNAVFRKKRASSTVGYSSCLVFTCTCSVALSVLCLMMMMMMMMVIKIIIIIINNNNDNNNSK